MPVTSDIKVISLVPIFSKVSLFPVELNSKSGVFLLILHVTVFALVVLSFHCFPDAKFIETLYSPAFFGCSSTLFVFLYVLSLYFIFLKS